jgi:hypothetical protein
LYISFYYLTLILICLIDAWNISVDYYDYHSTRCPYKLAAKLYSSLINLERYSSAAIFKSIDNLIEVSKNSINVRINWSLALFSWINYINLMRAIILWGRAVDLCLIRSILDSIYSQIKSWTLFLVESCACHAVVRALMIQIWWMHDELPL